MLEQAIAAAAGFLLAVLWFDLMFDVQVYRHRASAVLPEDVLASIAAYYRRVTTTASPMGRLVGLVMVVLLGCVVAQAIDGDVPFHVSFASILFTLLATGVALVRVVPAARRVGARTDSVETQSRLVWGIFNAHVASIVAISLVLAMQLIGA